MATTHYLSAPADASTPLPAYPPFPRYYPREADLAVGAQVMEAVPTAEVERARKGDLPSRSVDDGGPRALTIAATPWTNLRSGRRQ